MDSTSREGSASAHAPLIARYRALRDLSRQQSNRLNAAFDRATLVKVARRLGFDVEDGTLHLENEAEANVLFDYLLHDHREIGTGRRGRSAFEQLLSDAERRGVSGDELLVLRAHCDARFGIYLVDRAVPDVGAEMTDILRKVSFLLVDVGLAATAQPGTLFAMRVVSVDGLHMTSGAALPIHDRAIIDEIADELGAALGPEPEAGLDALRPGQRSRFSATILRVCLEWGASQQIIYR
jgi:hypothetical protein